MGDGENGEIHAVSVNLAKLCRGTEVIAVVGMRTRNKLWRTRSTTGKQQQRGIGNIGMRPFTSLTL